MRLSINVVYSRRGFYTRYCGERRSLEFLPIVATDERRCLVIFLHSFHFWFSCGVFCFRIISFFVLNYIFQIGMITNTHIHLYIYICDKSSSALSSEYIRYKAADIWRITRIVRQPTTSIFRGDSGDTEKNSKQDRINLSLPPFRRICLFHFTSRTVLWYLFTCVLQHYVAFNKSSDRKLPLLTNLIE